MNIEIGVKNEVCPDESVTLFLSKLSVWVILKVFVFYSSFKFVFIYCLSFKERPIIGHQSISNDYRGHITDDYITGIRLSTFQVKKIQCYLQ